MIDTHFCPNPARFDSSALLSAALASAGDPDAARREALRTALRSWRGSIDRAEAGLPRQIRRRQPGLTQEDVAELTGLSLGWYTLFENGSPKHFYSPRVVERVAAALRLTSEDRAILRILADRQTFQSVRLIVEHWERIPAMARRPRLREVGDRCA